MDRSNADRVSSMAVDMTCEVLRRITTHIVVACGENGDLVKNLVASAFVIIGTKVLKQAAIPIEDILSDVRKAYEEPKDGS